MRQVVYDMRHAESKSQKSLWYQSPTPTQPAHEHHSPPNTHPPWVVCNDKCHSSGSTPFKMPPRNASGLGPCREVCGVPTSPMLHGCGARLVLVLFSRLGVLALALA